MTESGKRAELSDACTRKIFVRPCVAYISPEIKYENEGGPTLEQCFALLGERIASGYMSGRNKLFLFHGVIFNFLIGNGDAHGKNFSILYEEGAAESLSPFYDLMCTVVYSNAHKAEMVGQAAYVVIFHTRGSYSESSLCPFYSLEKLSLRLRGSDLHVAPELHDMILNPYPDPPYGVGYEPVALVRIEFLNGAHASYRTFLNKVHHRKTVRFVLRSDFNHEPEV